MHLVPLLIAMTLGIHSANASGGVNDSIQKDIDSAIQEIMMTHVGQAICQKILGADPEAIEFHLGVSSGAAQTIAQSCNGDADVKWIFETSYQDIRKLTLKSFKPRKYALLSAETVFPIESWTDPFSNTTVLMAGREGVSHERLVQLLAHETAVYFDSKANPAHADAQNIPAIRDLILQTTARMNPLVAVTDPLIAHTLTFIRALQVEYAIVDELVAMRKIVAPADHEDPYLKLLISDQCREECLETLITNMRTDYLPIGLPLLAFAPHFRAVVTKELAKAKPLWHQAQWSRVQESLNNLPVEFLKSQFTGSPLTDLQRIFVTSNPPTLPFQIVAKFLNEDLWPIEKPAIMQTKLPTGATFLEFMKVPLLSGYNILLSSGPRVRVKPGNAE
ncbi:MAG: hypothetical protein ACXVA9_11955 [Bdellovibrionales bacterium]